MDSTSIIDEVKDEGSKWPTAAEVWEPIRFGREAEARKFFDKLCQNEAVSPADYAKRGSIALCLGDFDRAYQDYRKLHELTSIGRSALKSVFYLSHLGAIEWLRGNYNEAKRLWRAHMDGITDHIVNMGTMPAE